MAELQMGDKVRHPKRPEWGIDKIFDVMAGDKVRVFFINAGEKILALKHVALEKIKGAEASHHILDNPTFFERAAKGKGHMGLPDARLDFLKHFPEGFEDPGYIDSERAYKVEAQKLLLELLNEQEFSRLLGAGDFDEIVKRALQVANKTNLIFPNEKMGLKDGLKSPENALMFAERLFELLYGEGEYRSRLKPLPIAWRRLTRRSGQP